MGSLFNENECKELIERIKALASEDRPRFGSMSSNKAICHLIDSLRAAHDLEVSKKFRSSFMSTKLGQWLIVSSPLPWPKGKIKITADLEPVFFSTKPSDDFEQDKQTLIEEIEKFNASKSQEFALSPVFGKLSPEQWSKLQHRHIDHHLSQLGK